MAEKARLCALKPESYENRSEDCQRNALLTKVDRIGKSRGSGKRWSDKLQLAFDNLVAKHENYLRLI